MFRRPLALAALVPAGLLGVLFAVAQQPPAKDAPPANEVDAATREAAALEAQLGKLSSTSPEGAEAMLKLIDLYHANARPYGLIRVAQGFVAQHANHPRHKEVMLKLIDGLTAAGRNKELIAAGRQFVSRHPNDPACADVERWLVRLVARTNDAAGAAAINQSRWQRLGNTPEGQRAGRAAVAAFFNINNADSQLKAAALAEEMLDKLPAGGPATAAGWSAVDAHERRNDWAKANLAAAKLLAKSPPADPAYLRQLHVRMGENYSRLGQRTNAAASFNKAVAVPNQPPRPDLVARVITELYGANPKPSDIEPLVNDYVAKYPDRADRYAMRTLVAQTYVAAKEPAKAEAVLAEVLPFDARTHNAVGLYVSLFGGEPDMAARAARLAKAEQTLRDAVAKSASPANAGALRYALAIDILRDRVKDVAKAKAAARELAFQHPTADGYTTGVVTWLLDSAADEAEFKAVVADTVKARQAKPWLASLRNVLGAWAQGKAANKDFSAKVKLIRGELTAANADAGVAAWVAYDSAVAANAAANISNARTKLLAPEKVAAYPDDVAGELLYGQTYYLRHVGPDKSRPMAVDAVKQWVARLPNSAEAAAWYLQVVTDLGTVAEYKPAALAVMKHEPKSSNPDVYRRLMMAAGGAKDADLARQAWAWIAKTYSKFPYDGSYASSIGDTLAALKLTDEAADCWKRCVAGGHADSGDFQQSALRLLSVTPDAEKGKLLDELVAKDSAYQFNFALIKADSLLKAGNVDAAATLLKTTADKVRDRPFAGPGNVDGDYGAAQNWVAAIRADAKATPADKAKVFALVRDLGLWRASMVATMALLELPEDVAGKRAPMARLVELAQATQKGGTDSTDYDMTATYAQAAMARKDYMTAATLTAGMLANFPSTDEGRKKAARDLLTAAYTRLGAAGGAVIDENSPIAPLLQAALQLRLGDQKLAFDSYLAHQKLFDDNRAIVPVDLLAFVCEQHMAAGGDDNHNRVEDVLRSWLIKNSDSKELDEVEKARVQLLLARNYFRSRRYDLARAEFTTLLNRYAKTPQAVEAEFGIGETFMEQKVYDQAEQAFEKLAGRRERDVVIRAEFLRGVLANRRGDRDEARVIFRSVLERVPNIELANQALFNLSEVYGAEQRYMDQLELLRTIGRLGRASKRWHAPGDPLSIVVQDSDLGISRGHNRIPVKVTTVPGGDEETVFLLSGGAGKGLFRADLDTALGTPTKGDRVLQLTGNDAIKVDYPDEFKKEFKDVPLPDAEIRVAADGRLEIASAKIVDETEETFSQKLANEAKGDDEPKAAVRPKDQVKPGNVVYLRVKDADRDTSNEPDTIQVKLTAASGDQVSVTLTETGPHTGVFEGTAKTGELPAGAQATNSAIDHSPLMAIDKDRNTYWLSEPDGATPKVLTADMKDLKRVDRVTVWTPDAQQHAPVRMTLEGSDDGRLWFRLATTPGEKPAAPVAWESGQMTARLFDGGRVNGITTWDQVVALSKSGAPVSETKATELLWTRDADEKPRRPYAVVWHGKIVQPRTGAVRFGFSGERVALAVDGRLELPVGPANRTADVHLEAGTHDVTVFASAGQNANTLEARWVRGDSTTAQLATAPFRETDFDLTRVEAKPAAPRALGEGVASKEGTSWEFRFPAIGVRYARVVVHEYRGEAVAINHLEIADAEKSTLHIPTEADLLSLATNDTLEIAGGDVATGSYVDETNQTGSSRLLTAKLTATYHNGRIAPIGYDFVKSAGGGAPQTFRKDVLRIDPGERVIIEVTDFDQDQTAQRDTIKVAVAVNDGPAVELDAVETTESSGVFTKEVDTSAQAEDKKFQVKPGDRLYLRYTDRQNTLPGHAAVREAVVYVNEPTPGRVRIVESRAVRPKGMLADAPPRPVYLPARADADPARAVAVAIEAPLTVEVIDRDAAKDSRSRVVVAVTTTDGSTVDVECVLNDARLDGGTGTTRAGNRGTALEEGRFTGQVIVQLGGKDSPGLVPLTSSMPRNLIGGPKPPKEDGADEPAAKNDKGLVAQVLNVSGTDTVTAEYTDTQRPGGGGDKLRSTARLVTDGKLAVTDAEYQKPVTAVHVGERLFLKVEDADQDRTGERDIVKVIVTTKRGEKEQVELVETLSHSGVFTASVKLTPADKPTAGNINAAAPEVECYFGDTLEVLYADDRAASADGLLESKAEVTVVIGTDGKLQAFSKAFADENLAVETQFHIAESHFELFKSHKALAREEEAKADLESGRAVLRTVMEDYPNPKYAPRVAYLFGQFAQELKQHGEAVQAYQLIVKQYPDHTLAPDAQFKLAQCYEETNEFDNALEAYVTLAATYPKHPLIANVMVRISDHFYKVENFKVAAQVGEKFQEKFDGHKWTPKMAFRVGQCYYKDKQYAKAGAAFDKFVKAFPDDALASDALFWAGESYRTGGNNREAFRRYNECRWKYQASESAKYARGRLALPEMLSQFEAEAASIEEKK